MERADLSKFDLPDVPGVYLFTRGKGSGKKVLYVGKATSLRDRVRSYFDDDLIATRGPRVVDMVTKSDGITFETAPTVLEALVREAALIRKYRPKGNSEGKDDKTFLYAVITKESIPRVLAIRGKDIDFKKKALHDGTLRFTAIHGPFPSGYQLREGLRLIRKIFPFYDTDKPVENAGKHTRAKIEFNRQIGQYPRTSLTGTIGNDKEVRSEYMRSIKNVSLFLSGNVKGLRTALTKQMKEASDDERFEDAGTARRQLFALDHIQDVSLIKEDRSENLDSPRIEAYDTAHISGTNAIGVMVVVDGGIPRKAEYRTFKIRGSGGKSQNDDIASLKEILTRRLSHTEWPMPRVIVIDGGKTHKKAAESVLADAGIEIPVITVVKDEKHRPREILGGLKGGIANADAVLANAEAHRFSLARHRRARSRNLRTGG
jgi:excinuclease ABC subunit C